MSALLFIVVLERLSQDGLLLRSVKKDGALYEVHVDELLLEALGLVLAQLDVLVVDLLELDESEVRPGERKKLRLRKGLARIVGAYDW